MLPARVKNLLSRWRAKASVDARQNADVRRALVETLYASPASLAIGAIATPRSIGVGIMWSTVL